MTTELTKLSFDDNTIYSADDYFEIFRDTIFNNITVNDENKFIYTLLNNKQLYTYNLTQQNIEKTITNEITYTLDYIYSNIKFLYIYKTSNTGKSLKSIFLVEDYSYSNFSYTNKLRPVTNLYTYIDNYTPTTNITLYIADGYNTNKSFNIHLIKESIILNNGSYDISSNIVKDPNKLYMIYPDQLPRDQGLLNGSGNEDYLDLFFNKHSKDNKVYNIYNTHELLLPLCYLKYNPITDLYDKVDLATEITSDDYIYLYKDVIVFDNKSQNYNFVLINNNMYEFTNDSLQIPYTDNLYIKNKLIINDATISYDDKISFLLNSTDSLTFINTYSGDKYSTHDYIIPYSIKFDISFNDFDDIRMVSISSVTNTVLNLDTFIDTEYVKEQIVELNLATAKKTSIIYSNVTRTMDRNMLYIKNIFTNMFNENIYYKFYNNYTYDTGSTTNVIINLYPEFKTNITNYILTDNNINGEQDFYNSLQSVIINDIDLLIDNNETLYSKLMREIINMTLLNVLISTLHQIYNNDAYLNVIGAANLTYYVTLNNKQQ